MYSLSYQRYLHDKHEIGRQTNGTYPYVPTGRKFATLFQCPEMLNSYCHDNVRLVAQFQYMNLWSKATGCKNIQEMGSLHIIDLMQTPHASVRAGHIIRVCRSCFPASTEIGLTFTQDPSAHHIRDGGDGGIRYKTATNLGRLKQADTQCALDGNSQFPNDAHTNLQQTCTQV